MSDRIHWEPTQYGGWTGHVGAARDWLFQIWNAASVGGVWQLDSTLPGDFRHFATSSDPDELKAEAETRLAGFAASIGAVFPEPLLALADHWTEFATPGDAQDQCADELCETITSELTGSVADIVAASIEQQSGWRNELRHPGMNDGH